MAQVKYLKKILDAGSDNVNFFGGSFTGGYRIQQNPMEFSSLVEFLENKSYKKFLEIGSASGGSMRFLCENLIINEAFSIDLGNHESAHLFHENTKHLNVAQCICDSHDMEAYDYIREKIGKIDLCIIDGGHTYEDVALDILLVRNFLEDGAIVVFHDTDKIKEVNEAIEKHATFMTKVAHFVDNDNPFGISIFQYQSN